MYHTSPQLSCHAGQVECRLDSSEQTSPYLILAGILGLALFFNAEQLSQSLSFRISTGSLIFMLLAVLVLVFMLARYALDPSPVLPATTADCIVTVW